MDKIALVVIYLALVGSIMPITTLFGYFIAKDDIIPYVQAAGADQYNAIQSPMIRYTQGEVRAMVGNNFIVAEVGKCCESMTPIIRVDSKLLEIEYSGQELIKGDIVLYAKNSTSWIIHRIIGVYGEQVETKGDNNVVSDGLINKSQIKDIIVGVIY